MGSVSGLYISMYRSALRLESMSALAFSLHYDMTAEVPCIKLQFVINVMPQDALRLFVSLLKTLDIPLFYGPSQYALFFTPFGAHPKSLDIPRYR
jgi:hypothetical protein